jgi:hypothetical protein
MLRLQPRVKDVRKVPIPAELKDAMGKVFRLIEEARRDPDVNLDYDDAIHIGPVCGGRYHKKPSRYEFRYDPDNKRGSGTWYLNLHRCDIEDIADGRLTEITMHCCTSPDCGSKFNKADGHCDCDYVKDPDFGTFEFPEAIEKLNQRGVIGITETSSREDVLAALGSPDKAGGDITDTALGYIWPWIKYHRDDCQLRFEFDKHERVRNITVLKKDWEPGK